MAPSKRKHDIGGDDGHDPIGSSDDDVEKILSRELLQLSFKDRNDLQEEIHGVGCIAPVETPELIQERLCELAFVMDRDDFLPGHPKTALKKAIELQQRLQQETPKKQLYVFGDDFRLRFLRLELFDVNKAARRIIDFLDLLIDLFGMYALERPVRLSDFSEQEMQFIKRGCVQFMPFRDRSGRRILVFLPNEGYDLLSAVLKAKLFLYSCWTAGCDVETQRRGIVCVVWLDTNFRGAHSGITQKVSNPSDILSVRASAIHVCFPMIPIISQFSRFVLPIALGRNRVKTRLHIGSSIELKYQLQSYGIPVDLIPISWNGKVKTVYLDQWIRARKAIEEREFDAVDEDTTSPSNIIECPNLNDVIFKQGTSLLVHPGNAALRSLIEIKNKAQEEEDEGRRVIKMKRRRVVLEIYEEIISQHNGRFLIWNHDSGLWSELTDREQIVPRIEYLVKEHRKTIRAGQRRKEANKRRIVNKLENSDMDHGYFGTPPTSAAVENVTSGGGIYDQVQWSSLDVPYDCASNASCFGVKKQRR